MLDSPTPAPMPGVGLLFGCSGCCLTHMEQRAKALLRELSYRREASV